MNFGWKIVPFTFDKSRYSINMVLAYLKIITFTFFQTDVHSVESSRAGNGEFRGHLYKRCKRMVYFGIPEHLVEDYQERMCAPIQTKSQAKILIPN